MKKEWNKVVMVIGFLVSVLGAIIGAIESLKGATLILGYATSTMLVALLGAAFVFAKNSVVKNVGYGLAAIVGVWGIATIMDVNAVTAAVGYMISCVGAIIMLVASFIYFIVLALDFFGFVKRKSEEAKKACAIDALPEYKAMKDEQLLTDEEFEGVKRSVLENAEVKINSLYDLKKWKKLLDQKVITEEEFSAVKKEYFSK